MPARSRTIRLTGQAEQDIENILLYTRRTWGGEQTTRYRRAFARTWALLRAHPRLGQPRDDLFPGCRKITMEHHVVYYLHQGSEIGGARILHGHQDPAGKVVDRSSE